MAKFHGIVGIIRLEETSPGVYEEITSEYERSGDVIRSVNRSVANDMSINDDLVINNQISIIASPLIYQNFHFIKYVTWNNVKWKVTSVTDNYPRLILTLGDVYNGKQT